MVDFADRLHVSQFRFLALWQAGNLEPFAGAAFLLVVSLDLTV